MTNYCLPPVAIRNLKADGFCINGRRYNSPDLKQHIGETVMLFNSANHDEFDVCLGSELVCIATAKAVTAAQTQ